MENHKMSSIAIKAAWHKESYDRFLNEQLPQLLAERLPLAGYQVEQTGDYTCSVKILVINETGSPAEVTYFDVPQPDNDGIFMTNRNPWTVVPLASSEELEKAEILCVGDMLYTVFKERLGEATPDLPWSESLLRAWLPLDNWVRDRFRFSQPEHSYDIYFQRLDTTNWLARRTHLRRLFITLSDPDRVITPDQYGRLCPYEKPEGPNLGRIGVIAVGATIRDKKLVVVDERPEAALGLSLSVIPLIEHSDVNRLLMGANMMRQWLPYDQPEPALVQTGNEPLVPEFWCGRNLLTAFVSWGEETVEDGIILSQSGARHLSNSDHFVEPGDKVSNRYGIKGVVSRILPDAEMPKLADGTPVELLLCSVGLHSRLAHGQLWEAVLGRLARAEGEPILAPAFHGPSEAEVRQRLKAKGLPEAGMENLLHGETNQPLTNRSLVGWLYWGRTDHLVRDKIHVAVDSPQHAQRMTELEYQILKQIGAVETIRELFHLRAAWPDQNGEALSARIVSGTLSVAEPPTPRFAALQSRLSAAGIALTLSDGQLYFALQPSQSSTGDAVKLAQPVPHPWLSEHLLHEVGALERQLPNSSDSLRASEFEAVVRANEKLARLIASKAPTSLQLKAKAKLETVIRTYFNALLSAEDTQFDSRVLFSGRTVLAPGAKLNHDQIGLADEMAWTLFAAQVIAKLQVAGCNGETEVAQRSTLAAQTLDKIMANSWVIVHHNPTLRPTALVAFHPVRIADKVVRLPSVACVPMDADFDGDQAAVFLPLSEVGQWEAGELLSLEAHLKRDPALLNDLAPFRDPMLGLAMLSLGETGREQLCEILDTEPDWTPGHITRNALIDSLRVQLANKGAKAVIGIIDQLNALGFATLKASGVSLGPFARLGLETAPTPPVDQVELWESYILQRLEQLWSVKDYSGEWGHYLLASKSGALAENRLRLLLMTLAERGMIVDIHGNKAVISHGLREGLTAQEHFATVAGAQKGLRRVAIEWETGGDQVLLKNRSKSFHVLSRARRAANPGIVFARAAAMGEVDPLVDQESRAFVGV